MAFFELLSPSGCCLSVCSPQRHPGTPPNHQTTNTTKHHQHHSKTLATSTTAAWSNPKMQNTHRIEGSSLTAKTHKTRPRKPVCGARLDCENPRSLRIGTAKRGPTSTPVRQATRGPVRSESTPFGVLSATLRYSTQVLLFKGHNISGSYSSKQRFFNMLDEGITVFFFTHKPS